MPLFVGDARISAEKNSTFVSLPVAWGNLKPLLLNAPLETAAEILLAKWSADTPVQRFATWAELATAIKLELGRRENYFFQQEGENLNIDTVIFKTEVPTSSIGWSEHEFFEGLGNPGNARFCNERLSSRALASLLVMDFIKSNKQALATVTQALRRRAEQEYLMMNMVKGAMWDAAQVANQFQVGIAVRGTGLLAHMGIESGDPTKAQEFKNKTSKEADVILCNEMKWTDLGAVVHYDPRVAWSSARAAQMAEGGMELFSAKATEMDWEAKKKTLPARILKLKELKARIAFPEPAQFDTLKSTFLSRSAEYMEEDHEYRKGHYAPYTELVGPYVRLKVRPSVNMVGDHDLFAFTKPDEYGVFLPDSNPLVNQAQKALQNMPTFQAQHGGIWYWRPGTDFNVDIKSRIMNAHGPTGDEPLVYISPGKMVTAAYYTTDDKLASVWSNTTWTKWMKKTHSGGLLLNPLGT